MAFASVFGGQTLAAYKCTFFTHQSLQLASVTGVESAIAAFIATFELLLAFAVLSQLTGGGCGQLWGGDSWCGFDECRGKQGQAGCSIHAVQKGSEQDEDANGECQSSFAI